MEKARKLTALEEYTRKVYTIILVLIPSACLTAGLTYTLEKLIGWLPVNWTTLLLFDISCVLYLLIGILHRNNERSTTIKKGAWSLRWRTE